MDGDDDRVPISDRGDPQAAVDRLSSFGQDDVAFLLEDVVAHMVHGGLRLAAALTA